MSGVPVSRAYERGDSRYIVPGPGNYGGPKNEGTFECLLLTNSE